MKEKNESIDDIIDQLEDLEITTVHGRITEVVGMLIKAVIPQIKMGEICLIKNHVSLDSRKLQQATIWMIF